MSFFKNIFGGKKADAGPTASESIQKLRDTENMLLKKQEFLEQKVEAETKLAKENATTNKRGERRAARNDNCFRVSELATFVVNFRIFFVLFLCLRMMKKIIWPYFDLFQWLSPHSRGKNATNNSWNNFREHWPPSRHSEKLWRMQTPIRLSWRQWRELRTH